MSDTCAAREAIAVDRRREAIVSPSLLSPDALRLHRKAIGYARLARKAADARAAK